MTLYVASADRFWEARGRERVPIDAPVPGPSWPPTPGTYWPGPTTTGPRNADGTARTNLTRINGDYTVTAPGQVLEGLDIYGRLVLQSAAKNVTVRSCVVRGNGSSGGLVQGTAHDLGGLVMEDCIISAAGREYPTASAFTGWNYTLRRCEVARIVDGINVLYQAARDILIEDSWLHNGYYDEWVAGEPGMPTGHSDQRTHTDGIQLQRGKNITIRRSVIGGKRNPGAPHPAPYTTVNEQLVAYKDAGEDFENAALFAKQEVSDSDADRIENVLIEDCLFGGGAATVHLAFDPRRPNGTLSTLTLRNNKFLRSTWGEHKYIIKHDQILATLTGNVFADDGTPVPINRY